MVSRFDAGNVTPFFVRRNLYDNKKPDVVYKSFLEKTVFRQEADAEKFVSFGKRNESPHDFPFLFREDILKVRKEKFRMHLPLHEIFSQRLV